MIDDLITEAHRLLDDTIDSFVTSEGKQLAGIVTLFSGGNDSTVLAHLMRERSTHHGHCNTTIGIEATRQFVRDYSAELGKELIEVLPPISYRELVLERGFPGPAQHYKMYQRLKERGLRKIRKQLIGRNGRTQRVVFLAGRRRAESNRRANVPEFEREGSVVWCSPLVHFTDADMAAYREMHPEIPRNEVSDMLHMSGECLCGAFAGKHELEEIRFFFPEVAEEIRQLEEEATALEVPHCRWGWGAWREGGDDVLSEALQSGPMCSSCDLRFKGKPDEAG
jgi:3'-phosphoadenosine 5'-phosphosulfate sulfotransferase (PAPS reductase)/FAD synthetase